MAPPNFVVHAQPGVTAASDCPNDLDGWRRNAGSPHGSPVQTHHEIPACTVPYCRSTSYSLQWRSSSSANVVDCSSGRAGHQPHQRSYRSCSLAGELFDTHNSCRGIDRFDDPNGHLYDLYRDRATGPEHLNWPLLKLRTVGRKPVNIHQCFYSSKLVSCVSTSLCLFGNDHAIRKCGVLGASGEKNRDK